MQADFFNSSAEKNFPPNQRAKINRQKIRPKNPVTLEKTACRPLQTSQKRQIPREKPEGKINPPAKTPEKPAFSPLANENRTRRSKRGIFRFC
jgi:hypothetical protein